MKNDTAYREGREAFANGRPLDDNPFVDEDAEYAFSIAAGDWARGWSDEAEQRKRNWELFVWGKRPLE